MKSITVTVEIQHDEDEDSVPMRAESYILHREVDDETPGGGVAQDLATRIARMIRTDEDNSLERSAK